MSPQAELVARRLDRTRGRWRLCSAVAGAALAAGAAVAALAMCVLADTLAHLPQTGLAVLLSGWAALTAALVTAALVRCFRSRRDEAAAARRLEMELPELDSHLINLVQLRDEEGQEPEDPFRAAAIEQAAAAVAAVPFDRAAAGDTRRRRFGLHLQGPRDAVEAVMVLAAVLALGGVLHAVVPGWPSSVRRLLNPREFIPAVGTVQILRVQPGDTEVIAGTGLEITAEIANAEGRPYPATLYLRRGGEAETAQPMAADENNVKYVAALPQVAESLRYRLQIGDSQTRVFSVTAREKPTVAEVEITYTYPAYLGLPSLTVTQKHGDLEAPQYTQASLRIRPTTPVASGFLLVEGRRIEAAVGTEGDLLATQLLVTKNTTYTINLATASGLFDTEPRVNQVRAQPDAPPTVQLVEPAREASAAAGATVPVVVRAGDDNALGRVRVELKRGEDAPAEVIAAWADFPTPTAAVLTHQLALDTERFKPGQSVLIRAVARDRRAIEAEDVKLEPQEASTPWHTVKIIGPEARAAADFARLEAIHAAVWKILHAQLQARISTTQVSRQKTPVDARRVGGEVRGRQVEIQKDTAALVQSIGTPDDEERQTIKHVLNKLALGEMVAAVKQAEALAAVEMIAEMAKPAGVLGTTQDRIIDVLRRLLNEIRKDTADKLAEMEKRPGGDLPPDVKAKLQKAKDKLEEFLRAQKKVIEASTNLAKKPVEDFTGKEEQLLKELAAAEDDWSRFMADLHTDLSKLPEQDFANPSLLQELIEVQTALKMAEGALKAKTADIAVPLEQLGAEMAKEMTTNIEKWLPDTPDREKWSQEEPLTDDMKEAPMAELPGELEDIVGDLMENEEDLFDEMEDVSSSWADSIDKGAGWDAADGPISNMSARGVTGNRLPNESEIGGRSGEGRQGKSSGEFVGDTAVGKGGRKTPSRLTPDPYVKGQVKDKSKDPVGGATGGGKESGAGGQGLEGPAPNRPQREMERLAQKQAELRNKAESIDLKFKVLNYRREDLKKLAAMMAAVEDDLRTGRYQNALRRREVMLQGLNRVKDYVKGEFAVRQDSTPNLPTDIQKEILGSMQEASPAGWDRLNRQYFDRLAGTDEKRPPAPKPASPPRTR